jgi:hypothetical protein
MTLTEDAAKLYREDVEEQLKHWSKQKQHFHQKRDERGMRVCGLMLDKYLDKLLKLKNNEQNN